jgi:mannose/cellobiose epimerase-like protein (N-acyl-D-glucosamine 2-epimerase family)
MSFYEGRCLDASGGFFHYFKDDGTVYDRTTRHLVSSTRFVFNHSMAYRHFGRPEWQAAARHGLEFLRRAHWKADSEGYAWQLSWDGTRARVLDDTNHCYGLAFVLLAYAHALMAGVTEARTGVDETFDLMERRFWEPVHGLYADEATTQWELLPYRGQNANMHACEALLAAFDATGEPRFLDRAETLARSVTQRLAAQTGGLVWEHYGSDWQPDWDYHRNDRSNIFRPWGFQSGHLTEWAKLLLILDRHRPTAGQLERARELFDAALRHAWDTEHGGLAYGFAPPPTRSAASDYSVCDGDKYFWVQAESLAAAALLALRTSDAIYWDAYQRIWAYAWEHFVDHRHGAWYRILGPDNATLTDEKSPAGKTDYHTMGACYEVIAALDRIGADHRDR